MSTFKDEVDCKSTPSDVEGKATSTPNTPKGPTKIIILGDRSGSMQSGNLFGALIDGVNSLILEQKQVAEDLETEPEIEIWVFDTTTDLIRSGKIKDIGNISRDEVEPRGATALNDAMATILDNNAESSDVLFFIFTDGQENSSVKHRGDAGRTYCKNLVETYSKEKNWTVVFGAANIDAYHTGSQYGISADNAFNVGVDSTAVGNMMRAMSDAVRTSSTQGDKIDISMVRQVSAPVRPKPDEFKTSLRRESHVDMIPPLTRSVADGGGDRYSGIQRQANMTSGWFDTQPPLKRANAGPFPVPPAGLTRLNVNLPDEVNEDSGDKEKISSLNR